MIQYQKGVEGNIDSRKGRTIKKVMIATTPVIKLKSIGGQDTKFFEKIKFAIAHVTADPNPAMIPIILKLHEF